MSPTNFEERFSELVTFFESHRHLFDFANTEILTKNILAGIPQEWLQSYKDNRDIFENIEQCECSGPLGNFLRSIRNLKIKATENEIRYSNTDVIGSRKLFLGLSDKKRHEIEEMSRAINDVCKRSGVKTVIDLGSGLGYVSQLLHHRYGYKVIGLESDETRVKSALSRQSKYFPKSDVNYIPYFVSEESSQTIQNLVPDEPFSITGLHACADLTISALKLFLSIPKCKNILIMPCCYHKMKVNTTGSSRFCNFPISQALKNVCIADGDAFLNIPFMRLACQRTAASFFEDNKDGSRVFHVLTRALMELYAKNENCKLVKRKRRGGKSKDLNFLDFLEEFSSTGYSMEDVLEKKEREFNKTKIVEMWNSLEEDTFIRAELLVQLQDLLQPVCETLILEDKLAFMEESGVESEILKITDENISPRCYAIIASKRIK